ncbi:hypothetical protein B7463_g1281, partial [Scytalidium lignicola]
MLLPLAAIVSVALGAPVVSEFHYVHSVNTTKELRRWNYSTPIVFNGVEIGVNALGETATAGTVHALTDGHHFYQRDWFLTSANGASWEYLPGLRENFTSQKNTKRQFEEDIAWMVFNGNVGPIAPTQDLAVGAGGVLESVESVFAQPDLTEIGWDVISDSSSIIIDFIDDGEFITSSTALIGDLVDIFVNALDIFF